MLQISILLTGLNPMLKWINNWGSGAQVHLELPDNRPPGDWQLKINFPTDCPLQDVNVSDIKAPFVK